MQIQISTEAIMTTSKPSLSPTEQQTKQKRLQLIMHGQTMTCDLLGKKADLKRSYIWRHSFTNTPFFTMNSSANLNSFAIEPFAYKLFGAGKRIGDNPAKTISNVVIHDCSGAYDYIDKIL